MNLVLPVPVTQVAGARRSRGWRATLQHRGTTVWRCDCRPHARPELARECAVAVLSARSSGFYQGADMNEWLPVPEGIEAQQEWVDSLRGAMIIPPSQRHADLRNYLAVIEQSQSAEEVRNLQKAASSIAITCDEQREVREHAETVVIFADRRLGQMLKEEGNRAKGGEAYHRFPAPGTRSPEERVLTVAEKVGSRTQGWRRMQIAPLADEALTSLIREIHAEEKRATLTGVVKLLGKEESEMRRLDSMTSPALPNGKDYRVGDCREVLSDIEDDSIPLIMTDPPYEDAAEPLWEWLGAFANRVLIPGGSLICYFANTRLNKMYRILDDSGLVHWWPCALMYGQADRFPGRFVIIHQRPILWYVKEFRRGRTLIPNVVYSTRRNKNEHAWGQGHGGVTQWIHQLTDPGETIVDPFAGTGHWGDIAALNSRKWIGADLSYGGTTTVAAGNTEDI
jgi:hypothetical protein